MMRRISNPKSQLPNPNRRRMCPWQMSRSPHLHILRTRVALILCAALLLPRGVQAQERIPKLPYEGTASVAGSVLEVDIALILSTWRIKGAMACVRESTVRVCLIVENAWPSGLIEVVRQPGRSHLAEAFAGQALSSFADSGGLLFGTSSSHTTQADQGSHLQFAEAHVYTFVPNLQIPSDYSGIPFAVPPGPLFQVSYLSELDGFGWRTGFADLVSDPVSALKRAGLPSCAESPRVYDCAFAWASWWPRVGFLQHPSEPMAAGVQALRAGRAAAMPMGRAVVSPYLYEPRTGHWVQMLRPARRPGISIGRPFTRPAEQGAGSKHGAYLFLHYGVFEECKGCLTVRLTEPRVPAW